MAPSKEHITPSTASLTGRKFLMRRHPWERIGMTYKKRLFGSASFTFPPPAYLILNVSSSYSSPTGNHDDGMLFVYPNYRVNAFGFLSGRQVADSLRCLKQVDVQTLREASLQVTASHKYTTSYYSWVPVIDGTFLPEPLSEAVTKVNNDSRCRQSNLQFAFAIVEGTGDPPFNASVASFREWVAGYLPTFSSADRQRLEELYPERGSTGSSPGGYNDTYTRAGLVYRDSGLACPAYWITGTAPKGGWLGEYTIAPAKHASDVYWWNSVNSAQHTDRMHYEGYAGAMSSFFMTGDPNAMKLTPEDIPGVPPLKSGLEFVVDGLGFSTAGLTEFRKRCDFWLAMASHVPI
ncbi:carboxylesterase [Apiospora phragmitis]|uniref:Carboxylesterase n=1 Tax=Apiospora phragmitis TaxID=2905665 RepID=A0ABR1TRE5_9PEZI